MYATLTISTRKNLGRTKLAKDTVCGKCSQPLAHGQNYTVHAVRTAAMPASSYHYYHWNCAPAQGSGWGSFRPGEQVNDLATLRDGDVLLEYSRQFDAYNVVRVLRTGADGEAQGSGQKFYGTFVDPTNTNTPRLSSNGPFCIWRDEIGQTRVLYRAVKP